MDAIDVFNDLVTRPLHALDSFWEDLDPSRVNFRPAGHPNSIAWLLWHTARETDAQIAPLAGVQECWVEQGYVEHFGFTRIGEWKPNERTFKELREAKISEHL